MKVADVMTKEVVTTRVDASLKEVAALLLERRISGMPVVAEDGLLVGIVSRTDLIRALARSDSEIEGQISRDIVLGNPWLDPTRLTVHVRDGHVALWGAVENGTSADLLQRLVERVPGVVSVHAELTCVS